MAIYKQEHFGLARKIVATETCLSWYNIPHAVLSYEADVTELMEVCKKLNEGITDKTKKITLNTVMMRIICEGLKAAPKLNCTLDYNRRLINGTLNYHDEVNISMPIVLKDGRMTTVNMHDMGKKSLTEMTEAVNDTMRRMQNSVINETMYEVIIGDTLDGLKKGKIGQAINRGFSAMLGKQKLEHMKGAEKKAYYAKPATERLTRHDIDQGTITITNLGSVRRQYKGMCMMLEIIPPQVCAIAINAAQKRPTVVTDENGNEKIETRTILPLTIAMDHRALDFGDFFPFFDTLDEVFAKPEIVLGWR